ncbi:MAG: glutamate synthase-related protein, partial [Thaumarchaeota archaeon]|nr:glutamate synthase-related protein [Nitrososphaerota archaeon]
GPETQMILDLPSYSSSSSILQSSKLAAPEEKPPKLSRDLWPPNRINMLREMAGTIGKAPAEAEISSMGATSPPFVEDPARLSDYLVSDGAQVTRPSIDPYREEIEIFSRLPGSESKDFRLAAPFFFTHLPEPTPLNVKRVFARTALAFGLLFDANQVDVSEFSPYLERLLSNGESASDEAFVLSEMKGVQPKKIFWRIPSSRHAVSEAEARFDSGTDISGIIVDEDDPKSDLPLELAISKLDRVLKINRLRYKIAIFAESNSIRGADDVFKILALGADSVGLGRAGLFAIGFEEGDKEIIFDAPKSIIHLENFVTALEKEIKLLSGAAGVSSLSSSLVGNRELLRSIDLSSGFRKELGVKPAGGA